jgi:hypothetical protein
VRCPYIFCARCTDKLILEHGSDVFHGGCPGSFHCLLIHVTNILIPVDEVCKELCCCGSNKSINCTRQVKRYMIHKNIC